jgi:hypothetical protein
LPQPAEGELWADNRFVDANEDAQTVCVDLESMRDVHGLDIEQIEQRTNMTLEEMAHTVSPSPLVNVDTHKDIIDERRLALNTLGYDCRFRWQIASSRYNPGDMRTFFKRKIAACQQYGAEDGFGWIRHYDYGGNVTITTIYPSMSYEITPPKAVDYQLDADSISIDDSDTQFSELDPDENETTVTVYYGDRLGYDFTGTQTLWAKPVVFLPKHGMMIPLPDTGSNLDRRHTQNIMADAIDYHETVLETIDNLATTINEHIIRSRLLSLSFDVLPFSIEEFYRLIGIKSKKYRELAAQRVRKFAEPETEPTVWNLQLSLKIALVNEFQGNKAGRQYEAFQEQCGKMLRKPALVVQNAQEQYEFEQQQTDDDAADNDGQLTLDGIAESLNDVIDLQGISENQLNPDAAQRIENRVQKQITDIQSEKAD